jgi:hypothetical protein
MFPWHSPSWHAVLIAPPSSQDMILSGRAARVVVVAGDVASSDTLLPWLGNGFRALGAACTKVLSTACPLVV